MPLCSPSVGDESRVLLPQAKGLALRLGSRQVIGSCILSPNWPKQARFYFYLLARDMEDDMKAKTVQPRMQNRAVHTNRERVHRLDCDSAQHGIESYHRRPHTAMDNSNIIEFHSFGIVARRSSLPPCWNLPSFLDPTKNPATQHLVPNNPIHLQSAQSLECCMGIVAPLSK